VGSVRRHRRTVGRFACWLAVVASLAAAQRALAAEFLVADQVGNRIVAFDAETGAYTRTLWSTAERVQPAAMAFGPHGDLYFANRLSGDVRRIAQADLGGSLVAATPFITGLAFPGSLVYHAGTDSLLVGEFGVYPGGPLGDEIFVYNGAAQLQATLTLPQVGVAGMAFDAAGDLYASGFFTSPAAAGRVYKFDGPPTWQSQGAIAPDPYPWAELQGAAGIAFDATGAMYVAGLITSNSGDIVRFKFDQGAVVDQQRVGDFIPFPSGMQMLDDQLLVTSLGFGPTSGSVYRFNTETGARSTLLGGDFLADGVVDSSDLAEWRGAFEIAATGDADFDGDTDGNDFLAWQRGVGKQGAQGLFSPSAIVVYDQNSAVAIPEPAAAGLALAFLPPLWTRRQRARRRRLA
jgi:hypothetical protein